MMGGITNFLMGHHLGGDILHVSDWEGGKLDPFQLNPDNQPGGKNWLLKNPGQAPVGPGTPMSTGIPASQLPGLGGAFNNYLAAIGQPRMPVAAPQPHMSPPVMAMLQQLMAQRGGGTGPGVHGMSTGPMRPTMPIYPR